MPHALCPEMAGIPRSFVYCVRNYYTSSRVFHCRPLTLNLGLYMGDSNELTSTTEIDAPSAIELDAKLIAQEHRLFLILRNWFSREKFPPNDPRRAACNNALVWRMVVALAPSAAVTGAGLVGLFGLWVAYQSNTLLREQTEIIAEDAQASLRMRLIETLYQHEEPREPKQLERELPLPSADLGIAVFSHRARAEALRAFVDLERRRLRKSANPRIDVSYALLDHVDASGFDLRGVDLHAANMIASHLVDADLSEARMTSVELGFRFTTMTRIMLRANLCEPPPTRSPGSPKPDSVCSGDDFAVLLELDPKIWTAISCVIY